MPQDLIYLLVQVLLFALLAYGLYFICMRFLPAFPPALWICGAILLTIILYWAARTFGSGAAHFHG